MPNKERKIDVAMKEIEKLEREVDHCGPNAPLLVFKSMKSIEDSLSEGGEISYETYSIQVARIEKLATTFRQRCACYPK